MFRNARALVVLAGTVALVAGVLANAPAHAAETWSVVWNGTAIVPSSIPAVVSDQIILTKPGNVQDTIEAFNDTGELSGPHGLCDVLDACVLDQAASLDMTVVQLGDVLIRIGGQTVATLSLTGGSTAGADGSTGPYTMTFDGNGATSCTPTSASGPVNAAYRLPSPATCVRAGYRLAGWSHDKSATTVDDENLKQKADSTQGAQAAFADNGTLYAVWEPTAGVEVTYDSNVGWYTTCLDSSGKPVNDAVQWSTHRNAFEVATNNRVTKDLQTLDSDPRHTAMCKPQWFVLAGWSTSPLDAFKTPSQVAAPNTFYALDKHLNATNPALKSGSRLTLYAMWTWPNVTVHHVGVVPNFYVVPPGGTKIEWESVLPMAPAATDGFLAPESETVKCTNSIYIPAEANQYGQVMWIEARDKLGAMAPFTSVVMGASNASLQFGIGTNGEGDYRSRIKSGPNGIVLVQTGASGTWPDNGGVNGNYDWGAFLTMNVCPPSPSATTGSTLPGLWVLSGAAPNLFGRIYFDPLAYFPKG